MQLPAQFAVLKAHFAAEESILFVVAVTSASQNVKNSTPAQPQLMKTREPHKKEKHFAKELKGKKKASHT